MRVITIGAFDLLHEGHRELFDYGYQVGLEPVFVGVNSDEFVRTYKGEPAQDQETRGRAVLSDHRVAAAVLHHGDTLHTIRRLNPIRTPALLLIGSDWHDRDYLSQLGVTWDQLRDVGIIGILYAHRPSDGPSSTKLRAQLREDYEEARQKVEGAAAFGDPSVYDEINRVLSYSQFGTEEDGCRD